MTQDYFVHVDLEWGEPNEGARATRDFYSVEFDDDQQLCMAVASTLLEEVKRGRILLAKIEGEGDEPISVG
jgi:hypothetical protein